MQRKKNGIVISHYTKDAVKKALKKATTVDRSDLNQMKVNATTLAEKKFDYRSYEGKIAKFLNK